MPPQLLLLHVHGTRDRSQQIPLHQRSLDHFQTRLPFYAMVGSLGMVLGFAWNRRSSCTLIFLEFDSRMALFIDLYERMTIFTSNFTLVIMPFLVAREKCVSGIC